MVAAILVLVGIMALMIGTINHNVRVIAETLQRMEERRDKAA